MSADPAPALVPLPVSGTRILVQSSTTERLRAAFEIVEAPRDRRDRRWAAFELPAIDSARSIALADLAKLTERRADIAAELDRLTRLLAGVDAQIFACRDIVQRVDAVCRRHNEPEVITAESPAYEDAQNPGA